MFNLIPFKSHSLSNQLFDHIFEDYFDLKPQTSETFAPPVDFSEDENTYHLDVELPGVNKEDLDISLEKNILTISGEKKREFSGKNKRTERYYGKFVRSFSIPDSINKDQITANFKDGGATVEVFT